MTLRVDLDRTLFAELRAGLARPEQVAFLFAAYDAGVLTVDAVELMSGADIASQSDVHVELADAARARVIKRAWDTDAALIEAHSHGPRGVASFSASDLAGFEDWVPHVMWRLRGRPYAALVVAGASWDALGWIGDEQVGVSTLNVTAGDRPPAAGRSHAQNSTLVERKKT